MSGAMAAQVNGETWQQLVLASLSAVLLTLLGWISFGPQPEPSEDDEQEASKPHPLPIFGANFTQEALKEAKQGGRRKKGQAKQHKAAKVEEAAAAEEPIEEEQEEIAVAAEEAVAEEEEEVPELVEEEPVPEPVKTSKKKKKGGAAAAASKAEPVAPASAAAPAPALVVEEVAFTPEQKACQNEVRKVQKKLREINELKVRQASGDDLTSNQQGKVAQESALLQALQDAEKALEEALKPKEEEAAPQQEPEEALKPKEEEAAPQQEPEEAFTEQALVDQVVVEDLHFPDDEEPEVDEFQQTKAAKKKKNRSQRKQQQVEQQKEQDEAEAVSEDIATAEEEQAEAEVEAEVEVEAEGEAEEAEAEEEAGEAEEAAEEGADEAAEEEEEEEEEVGEEEDWAAGEDGAEADDAAGESPETSTEESDETKEETGDWAEDQEAQVAPAEEDAAVEEAPAEEQERETSLEEQPEPAPAPQPPKDYVKPTYPPTEREKEMMKLKKKIREIEDLERKQQEGVKLAANQEAKLLKKAGLLEELEVVEAAVEPHTIEWNAVVHEVMNPLFGVMLKVDGRSEMMSLSAAHMNPPIHPDNLGEINTRYTKGQDLKVRIRRDGSTCTDMSVDEEDMSWQESEAIAAELKTMKEEDDKKMEDLWNQGTWSDEECVGTVVAVKDQCIFVRVMGAREVRVSSADMSSKLVMKDPISKVSKTKRDAVKVGMDVNLRLRYDYRNERIIGSMIVQVQNGAA